MPPQPTVPNVVARIAIEERLSGKGEVSEARVRRTLVKMGFKATEVGRAVRDAKSQGVVKRTRGGGLVVVG